jgi:Ala-tRNA(Pro) deacylase
MEVYVDRAVIENDEIVFNAGTHTDTLKIKYRDFDRLVHPKTADFSKHI